MDVKMHASARHTAFSAAGYARFFYLFSSGLHTRTKAIKKPLLHPNHLLAPDGHEMAVQRWPRQSA